MQRSLTTGFATTILVAASLATVSFARPPFRTASFGTSSSGTAFLSPASDREAATASPAPATSTQQDAPPPKPKKHQPGPPDPAAERGQKQYSASCAFCHGPDATGARAPDLLRSPIVMHDEKGNLIGDVIHNGRPDKGMPALPLTDDQIADIAAYLHARIVEGLNSAEVPEGYPAEKLLTGNAQAGKAFFEGAGGCTKCHSVTGDLAGVSSKYSAIDLESHMLYPEGKFKTVSVTLPTGEQIEGKLAHADEFSIALRDSSGWYRSFHRDQVKVEIHDGLSGHRELLNTLTQTQIHDLFAYMHSLEK